MGAEISSMFVDKSDAGLEAAFAKMDYYHNGKINTAELKAYILQSYGSTIDDKTIREMMATADTNMDGEMDLNEFKVIIRAGPSSTFHASMAQQAAMAQQAMSGFGNNLFGQSGSLTLSGQSGFGNNLFGQSGSLTLSGQSGFGNNFFGQSGFSQSGAGNNFFGHDTEGAMEQQAMAQYGAAGGSPFQQGMAMARGGSPFGHQPRGCEELIMRMNATPHSSDKMELIESMCPHINDFRNIHLVFKGLTFSSDIVSAAELFGRHCQGNLPAEALVEVLNCTPHSSDKMRIIEAMRYKVVGNKQCVIDHLTFSSDKDQARQLLF